MKSSMSPARTAPSWQGRTHTRSLGGALGCAILAAVLVWSGCQSEQGGEATEGGREPDSKAPPVSTERGTADARSAEIAEEVMDAMGGARAWNDTRYLSWKFMGARQHYWDKWTGNVRIESNDVVILMNVNTKTGHVQKGGVDVVDAATLNSYLERGYAWWVNDSYWMFMPYKLRDPGVDLTYAGERTLANGKPADVLTMTFRNVGLTPNNKYDVMVDRETGLVVQWSYYENATDTEPKMTTPWDGWQQFGDIKLATQHGQAQDWQIRVHDDLPATVFASFAAVQA